MLLFRVFLRHKNGSLALAQAFDAVLLSRETAERGLWTLYATGRVDEQPMNILSNAAGISGQDQPYSLERVQTLIRDSVARGDAARGMMIFQSQ